MSWKPEVQVMNEGDKWHRNGLVFATREEAEANAQDLYSRWTMTTAWRAVEVDEPVNYRWVDGALYRVEAVS
jgi:hypothetical protein